MIRNKKIHCNHISRVVEQFVQNVARAIKNNALRVTRNRITRWSGGAQSVYLSTNGHQKMEKRRRQFEEEPYREAEYFVVFESLNKFVSKLISLHLLRSKF
jgi:hypothetical protein